MIFRRLSSQGWVLCFLSHWADKKNLIPRDCIRKIFSKQVDESVSLGDHPKVNQFLYSTFEYPDPRKQEDSVNDKSAIDAIPPSAVVFPRQDVIQKLR